MGMFPFPTIWHLCQLWFLCMVFSCAKAQVQIMVTNPIDSAPNASFCIPSSNLCNLRSAWQACVDQLQPSTVACDIVLPDQGLLLMNNIYGSMKLNISSVNITINGNGAAISPVDTAMEWINPLFDIEGPALNLPQIGCIFFSLQDTRFINFDGSSIHGTVLSARGLFEVSLSDVHISGIQSYAGAIFAQGHNNEEVMSSIITILQSSFSSCFAMELGAALFLQNAIRTEIYSSQFVDLMAGNGSAISALNLLDSISVMNQSNFVNCSATGSGGAVYAISGTVTKYIDVLFSGSTFSGISSRSSGGVMAGAGNMNVVASSVSSKNTIAESGGGGFFLENINFFNISNSHFEDSSGGESFGGYLYVVGLSCNVFIVDTTFNNMEASLGGSILVGNIAGIELKAVAFSNSSSVVNGAGAIQFISVGKIVVDQSTFVDCFSQANGGGIILNDVSSAVISNSIFLRNVVPSLGGTSILVASSTNITLDNVQIIESSSSSPGAVALMVYSSSNIHILNCLFLRNRGGNFGVYQNSNNLYVWNTTFDTGYDSLQGGAVTLQNTNNIAFEQCSFLRNQAITMGGAVYASQGTSNLRFVRCTFENNMVSAGSGGAIYVDSNVDQFVVAGCTFDNNMATANGGAVFLNDENTNVVVMAYDNYPSLATVQSPHPYVSAYPVNGVPYTISTEEIVSTNAHGYIVYFNTQTSIFIQDTLNIYGVSSSGNKTLYFSGNSNFPGVQAPALYVSGRSIIFDFVGPPNSDFVLSSDFGFIAYVVPVTKHPEYPTIFTSNAATQNGGAMFFLFDNEFPVITNTNFENNTAVTGGGGGVFFELANYGLSMWEVYFKKNSAVIGGGLVLGNGHFGVTIYKCYFYNSTAAQYGGALSMTSGNGNGIFSLMRYNSVNISSSDFFNNTASEGGGGSIYLDIGNIVELVRCNLNQNRATKQDGGAIKLNQNNQLSMSKVLFQNNTAAKSGGAVSSLASNQVFLQHSQFFSNTAELGGGALVMGQSSQLTFCADSIFQGNIAYNGGGAIFMTKASFWSGGYFCLFSGKKDPYDPSLNFIANSAPRGSAVLLYQVTFDQTNQVNMVHSTFESNVAAVGGTFYWVKDSVMSSEPPGLNNATALEFSNNIAAYGNRSATQAIQTILPLQYDVTVYGQSLVPPINIRIADYYGQMIPLNGTSTVYPSVVESGTANCSGYFPYLSGHDLAGDGVSFENGVATFSSLSAYCAPDGHISVQFEVRLGANTVFSTQLLESYYITNSSAFSFRSCSSGEFTSNGVCTPCPTGSYNLNSINALKCDSCIGETGVLTCNTDVIVLDSGFWRRYPTNQAVLPCTLVGNCNGGNLTGDSSCAVGYEGPLCGVCQSGYYFTNNACEQCGTKSNLSPSLAASLIFIIVIFILISGCAFYKYVYVPDDLDLSDDSVSLSTIQLIYLWCKMKYHSFIVKVKIITANVQIVTSAANTFKVHLPITFSRFSNGFGVLNFNLANLITFGCSVSKYNFFGRLVIATALPIVVVALFVLAYGLQYIFETMRYHKSLLTKSKRKAIFTRRLLSLKNSYITYLFYITYFILPMVTTTIFQTFLCTDIDPQHENPTEPSLYMTEDLSISCESDEYYSWRIYAVMMIFVYPVGIPALYFTLLYMNREDIMHRDDDNEDDGNENMDVTDKKPSSRKRTSSASHASKKKKKKKSKEEEIEEPQESDSDDEEEASQTRRSSDNTNRNTSNSNDRDDDINNNENSHKDVSFDNQGEKESTKRENESSESPTERGAMSPNAARLSFLWLAYEPKFWYWEIVETTRRLLLTACLSVISPGTSPQNVLSLLLALLYVKLYGYFKPYAAASDDIIAEVGQFQVFFTFFTALVVENNLLSADYDLLLGVLLVLINLGVFVCTIFFEMEEYREDIVSLTDEQSLLTTELLGRFSIFLVPFATCFPSFSTRKKEVLEVAPLRHIRRKESIDGNEQFPPSSSKSNNAQNTSQFMSRFRKRQKYQLDGDVAATQLFRRAVLQRQHHAILAQETAMRESAFHQQMFTIQNPLVNNGDNNAAVAPPYASPVPPLPISISSPIRKANKGEIDSDFFHRATISRPLSASTSEFSSSSSSSSTVKQSKASDAIEMSNITSSTKKKTHNLTIDSDEENDEMDPSPPASAIRTRKPSDHYQSQQYEQNQDSDDEV